MAALSTVQTPKNKSIRTNPFLRYRFNILPSPSSSRMQVDYTLFEQQYNQPLIILCKNKSPYIIFIVFFVLCASILVVTGGDLASLAGVYTIAFLSVMILFSFGNVLLKLNRKFLPRPEKASWLAIFIATSAVLLAIIGNVILNPSYVVIFFEYLIPTLIVVYCMLYRTIILKAILSVIEYLSPENNRFLSRLNRITKKKLVEIRSQQFVFFTNHDNVETLNKVMLYMRKNEPTRILKIVAVINEETESIRKLKNDIYVLDRAYPDIQINFIEEPGIFGPEKIKELSQRWKIPVNFMFIGAPGERFPYKVSQLGEVRLII